MTTQTQTPEERLSKLEGAYEQVNERLRDLTQGQAALGEQIRQVDAALREEIRQGDAALRALLEALRAELHAEIVELRAELRSELHSEVGALRASQDAFRSEMHAAFQRQTYLIIASLGALWASMVGGFIALFLSM